MPIDGDFSMYGRSFTYDVVEISTFDGDTFTGPDIEEHIHEADQVFYKVTSNDGEDFYRWLGGPFENMDSVHEAIVDETDAYEGGE